MSHFFSLDTLIEVLLGISLSVAAGFRVFVPLLVLSGASVVAHLNLPTDFDWLETPQALAVFAIACVLEITGYYVPWLDHLLDIVSTPAAVITGTVVAASLTPDVNPVAQWTLALIAGGGAAGLTKGVMNLFRLTSTAASGGLTNPILATIELVLAVTLSVLAVTVPLVAGALLLILLIVGTQRLWVFLAALRSPQITDPSES
ncbi:DUF4126 domain-containing protein [Leptolyngbya sp. FACHB-671]|uniref:DUF4126 domain-containing protein n=1 Tax=Leptolyngbya sp. FACHB-671 TaxID=2692812 RepID=UPI00168766E9|nr:DUF4126 domain-containing protein [Leptolyngbya sp. FACHB-671]MBD2070138.1 DUF4126 domain-containing protein [Leptolyngbya sp. FACHB-671]